MLTHILWLGVLVLLSSLRLPHLQIPSPSPSPNPSPQVTYVSVNNRSNISPSPAQPWGVAKQLTEHTWTIRINNDPVMGSPEEILKALNDLRIRHGSQPLHSDSRLCAFAQDRAKYFASIKSTDEHKGFVEYLANQDGFYKLGYGSLGENSSYGYIMSGVHLIEQVYNSDPDHSANQLNSKWDHACVGVSGPATNLIFATSPL